ncbi:protein translocase subunit SecF [candidate division WOR-3 bacterium]|nr:protein translocase subunit SecF [candidate division WOR-3 bacterium]
MFEILKETRIPFSRLRYIGFIASGVLIVLTVILLLVNGGPNYGIDFEGGSKIGLSFSEPITTEELRSVLVDIGETNVKIFRIQDVSTGSSSFQIQVPPKTMLIEEEEQKSFSQRLIDNLETKYPGLEVTLTGEETVSAAFGKELQWDAILALLLGMALILIYIWIRIDFRFGVGTVVATFHDVLIALGIITLLGIRIDITVIAAFLTIIGYSVNDSIVISKRIQELIKTRRGATLTENIDAGINITLSRTIVTSITTLFVSVAVVIFASGTAIFPFAMTMTIGIIIGTYSSSFIVAPIVVELERVLPSHKRRT